MSGAGQPLAAADAPFRMQATALGQYLIYGVHGDFLGAGATPTSSPATDTVWQVGGSAPRGFTLTNLGTGQTMAVRFTSARGCAVYPGGNVHATGTQFRGASPRGHVPRRRGLPADVGARLRRARDRWLLPAGSRLGARGLSPARLGLRARGLLFAAGQPATRPGRSFCYCVTGARGAGPAVRGAGSPRPGARHGLWIGRPLPGGTHLLYRIRAGRVAWVAAITAFDARRVSRIHSDVRAAGLR